MVAFSKKITSEALNLPVDLRAALVNTLIESMNMPSQKQIDTAWAKEAEKRLAAVKSGKTKTIPGEKVFSAIRAKYGR